MTSADADDGSIEDVVVDAVDDVVPPALVASVEPGVVFSSLAAHTVPGLCDTCTVDMVDGLHARYRIAVPQAESVGQGLARRADRAGVSGDQRVRVAFAHSESGAHGSDGNLRATEPTAFRGVVTFAWHRRVPSRADRVAATVLVDYAVEMVLRQRSEAACQLARSTAKELRRALRHSRRIGAAVGIVMSQHKVTEDYAFEMLRRTSQQHHCKVHILAEDVIAAGRLDPMVRRSVTTGSAP